MSAESSRAEIADRLDQCVRRVRTARLALVGLGAEGFKVRAADVNALVEQLDDAIEGLDDVSDELGARQARPAQAEPGNASE